MKYRVKKELNNWLKENGFGEIKVYNHEDFEAQSDDNLIGIADHFADLGTDSFIELVQDLGLEYDTDIMTLYTLHELGHTQTWDEFDSVDEAKYYIKNWFITKLIAIFGMRVYNKLNYLYQRLPQERRATEWAVNYLNNNIDTVRQLEKILAKTSA